MPEDIITYTPKLEKYLRESMGDDATPELLNMVAGAIAAHEHAFSQFGITKEKYLEWIGRAWDVGIAQRKIYDCEVEGGINNQFGVSMGFGGSLALFGKRNGYIVRKGDE